MKLQITSFADPGVLEKERVVIAVRQPVDIGQYAMFITSLTEDDGSVTAGRKTAYWFPDAQLNAADKVVVYTKSGTNSKKEMSAGGTAWFFYLGLDRVQWNLENKAAVILHVDEWRKASPRSVSS